MHSAFLQEIIAHPHDLSSRYAYADYLMEQDLPALREQGEFIALQLQLQANQVRGMERAKAEFRVSEMLARCRSTWELPLRATGAVSCCVFRNGFVEEIHSLPDGFIIAAEDGLLELAPITGVFFGRLQEKEAQELASSPYLARLTSLTVEAGGTTPVAVERLLRSPYLTNLRRLVLDRNNLGDDWLTTLSEWEGLGKLEELRLFRTHLSLRGLETLLQSPHLNPALGPVALRRLEVRANNGVERIALGRRLNALEPILGGARVGRFRRALASLLGGATKRELRRSQSHGVCAATFAAALTDSSAAVREQAAGASIDPKLSLAVLPELVQRYGEKRLRSKIRGWIREYFKLPLPGRMSEWLFEMLRSDNLPDVVVWGLREKLDLTPDVQRELAALLQRRLAWRASHGRATSLPSLPNDGATNRDTLALLAQQVTNKAAEAALRHLAPQMLKSHSASVELHARQRESAWLARWIVATMLA